MYRVKQWRKVWVVQKKFLWWWRDIQLFSSYDRGHMGGASFTTEESAKEFMEGIIAKKKFRGIYSYW